MQTHLPVMRSQHANCFFTQVRLVFRGHFALSCILLLELLV